MSLPKQSDILLPLLKAIGVHGLDGKVLLIDLVAVMADHFGLTQDEQSQISTDGRRTKIHYLVEWTSTDLIGQGLIEIPERSYRRITYKGLSKLGVSTINPISGYGLVRGVLDVRPDSGIDNVCGLHYHFPKKYLREMEKLVGNWFVYREVSGGGGRHGYVAISKVTRIEPDDKKKGYYYAYLDGCKEFDEIVPFKSGEIYAEEYLNRLLPTEVGPFLQRNSVRTIYKYNSNLDAICSAGSNVNYDIYDFNSLIIEQNKENTALKTNIMEIIKRKQRKYTEMLIKKLERDIAFRSKVMEAYRYTCSFTGISINNGKGLFEAQAAHILPVANNGPDVVQNGIALSSTCHWLFDHHLISISDNYRLNMKENRIPERMRKMLIFNNKRIHLPTNIVYWPDIDYIRHHWMKYNSK